MVWSIDFSWTVCDFYRCSWRTWSGMQSPTQSTHAAKQSPPLTSCMPWRGREGLCTALAVELIVCSVPSKLKWCYFNTTFPAKSLGYKHKRACTTANEPLSSKRLYICLRYTCCGMFKQQAWWYRRVPHENHAWPSFGLCKCHVCKLLPRQYIHTCMTEAVHRALHSYIYISAWQQVCSGCTVMQGLGL